MEINHFQAATTGSFNCGQMHGVSDNSLDSISIGVEDTEIQFAAKGKEQDYFPVDLLHPRS